MTGMPKRCLATPRFAYFWEFQIVANLKKPEPKSIKKKVAKTWKVDIETSAKWL